MNDANFPSPKGESARSRLLEAAGQVFAEKGFDRATAKEICIRAGLNAAAVNYYYGSKEGLYQAVLQAAHLGIVTREELSAVVPLDTESPEAALRAMLRLLLERLFAASQEGWRLQVLTREMGSPTAMFATLVEGEIRPKTLFLRSVVARLLEREIDEPLVSRCAASVISQVLSLFLNRVAFSRLFPGLEYGPDFVDVMTEHIFAFSLAGIQGQKEGG